MTAILTRRSEQVLVEPSPSAGEFTYLLRGAAAAPDHGTLRPWRWITLHGTDREALADCLAEEAGAEERPQIERGILGAPMLAALVFAPEQDHDVPEWEQLAATSAMAHALMLLLHARNYGSIWRTGRLATSPAARTVLGLAAGERLLGALSIGTPRTARRLLRKPMADVASRVSAFPRIHQ
ncbi:nitroreductase family protein [Kitasatospora sp. MAA4]|uniref:nitroreductase family protein n=1 Tax=Kitasatospora sp. MAA4 TaxID=3035093 RepID=UPI00247490EC|nr:nitroreductase family protein [Kitasatospora sp. MAA4]